MCGIAGRWDNERHLHPNTIQVLRHRGPDDEGHARFRTASGPLEMIQTRLAILDTSDAGHQPMTTPDGRYTILLNGEIYNFRTLRKQLAGHWSFHSETDTEVVLQAYAHWGVAAFARLDGMFAIAVWDRLEETLTLARDPLGIKPLYVSESSSGLIFGSELKALLLQPECNRAIRKESVAEYVSFLWIPEPHTMFQHIEKLPAGHFAVYRKHRNITMGQFFDLKKHYEEKVRMSETEAIARVKETLRSAVRDQMISDVPLGAFFSGGLDSTMIVSEMAKVSSDSVITETVGFQPEDQKYDIAPSDVLYARRALPKLPPNIHYHETLIAESSLGFMPEVVGILDDPIGDPAAISTLLISRAVAPHATVMLSGMGAEELWGGYARYWATLSALASWGKLPRPLQDLTRGALARIPSSRPSPFMGTMRQAKKYVRASGRNLPETFITFESYIDREDLNEALMPGWQGGDPWAAHLRLFRAASALDPIDQMSYVDALTFLPALNLAYTDRASMAASIEVRVPFLAQDMVKLAAQLPGAMRLRGNMGKYAVKRAALEMGVPTDIVWRKKSGFGAPVRSWMSRQNHPLIQGLLHSDTIRERGVLNPDYVSRLRFLHRSGREDYGLQLYSFMVLEQWFRTYVDRTALFADGQSWEAMTYGNQRGQ